ncbi:3-oxoacyl-[acyl-carrier-protein] synthase 2 [Vibrio nigripulchritudo]|uniref:beta-ketoacyl synthase N-terminal-like domain-containing protein n=1 Tax=Vibrio nigripulchritudo TaxID=28173 RepID=UPI00190D7849|nr:beta-ketoacyl synthase N-terminal-like domain-containing protein [Vibrio nigripulchritudo]BCL70262.1 3-oxoacyl-[acyl-carrier-protein] synthase 2 [Vibrio nigripulchritudo]BDU31613.1 3-oxoacyl-[acyl-carrier-protein] synthase 2 [Vibrio nigripulchritudo]
MPKPNAVITGLGGLTSLGITSEQHLAGHQQGESGIRFNDDFPYPLGAVPDFNPREFIKDKKSIRMMTLQVKLGVSSASLAFDNAGLEQDYFQKYQETCGVIYGSFLCQGFYNSTKPYMSCLKEDLTVDYDSLGNEHYRQFPPLWILPRLPNTAGGQVSIQYGLRGMSYSVVNGPAGGMIAAGEAMEAIEDKRADMILAGATESEAMLDHAFRLEQRLPVAKSLEDTGLVAGEGGISYVIENSDIALQDNRSIYAHVLSYQNNYLPNLFSDSAELSISSIEANIRKAIKKAGLTPEDIDAVQLTLAGIPDLDEWEATAAQRVFGNHTPVVSSTDYTGFSFGAAGASSLFYACLQLKHQYLAPVLNLSRKPLQGALNYVKEPKLNTPIQRVLCHHIDYLGNQVSLLLAKESKE